MYVYVLCVCGYVSCVCMRTCMCVYATVDHQSRALKRDMDTVVKSRAQSLVIGALCIE